MSWHRKTYEELPALSIRNDALRSALRIVTAGYVLWALSFACVGGAHLTVFLKMLGFSDLHFGIMAAIPFAATFLLQLVAAVLIERNGFKKHQFIQCASISRALWLLIAAIPFVVPMPSAVAALVFLVAIGVSSALMSLAVPAWQTWMGDLIPRRIRGRYLARRQRIGQLIRFPAVIAISILLVAVTVEGAPKTAEDQPDLLWVMCGLFAIGAVLGTLDILLFRRIREVLPSTPDGLREPAIDIRVTMAQRTWLWGNMVYGARYLSQALRQLIVEPLQDRSFRRYVLHGAAILFAVAVSGAFFWRNCLENIGFGILGTNVLILLAPLGGILASGAWGKVIDRWGRRPALLLATAVVVFSITPWFFIMRSSPAPAFVGEWVNRIAGGVGLLVGYPEFQLLGPDAPVGAFLLAAVAFVVGGAAWTGIEMSRMSITLGFADGKGRSRYIAAAGALVSIGGVLGGLVGGAVTEYIGTSLKITKDSPIGPFEWNNWHAAFALSMLARIVALLFALRLPDPGSTRMRDVVRLVSANAYSNLRTYLLFPQRTFIWRRRKNRRPDLDDDDVM